MARIPWVSDDWMTNGPELDLSSRRPGPHPDTIGGHVEASLRRTIQRDRERTFLASAAGRTFHAAQAQRLGAEIGADLVPIRCRACVVIRYVPRDEAQTGVRCLHCQQPMEYAGTGTLRAAQRVA